MNLLGCVQSRFAYLQGRRTQEDSKPQSQYLACLWWKISSSKVTGIPCIATSTCCFSSYQHVSWSRHWLLCNLLLGWLNSIKVSTNLCCSPTHPHCSALGWRLLRPCPSSPREPRAGSNPSDTASQMLHRGRTLPQPSGCSPINLAERASHLPSPPHVHLSTRRMPGLFLQISILAGVSLEKKTEILSFGLLMCKLSLSC